MLYPTELRALAFLILKITSELKLKGLDNEQFEAKLKELKELVDENEKLVVENTAFKNKIELAEKRFGKGWDYPPCFLNKNGTSNEYIYEIDIYKTKYVIRPAWPKDKHSYVSKIPGVSLFSGELTKKIDDFLFNEFIRIQKSAWIKFGRVYGLQNY